MEAKITTASKTNILCIDFLIFIISVIYKINNVKMYMRVCVNLAKQIAEAGDFLLEIFCLDH